MQRALEMITEYRMIEPGDRIVAGVSGGADSVCLLIVLLDYRKNIPFEIKVVHVEHGIRGEDSRRDAQYVEELCKTCQVEFECVSCDIPAIAKEKRLSEEEAGRLFRYEAFERVRKEWNGNKIAVAHNQNDQAETILWNLARGSGLDGAAGIRPVRDRIIRPLLACERKEIEAYLTERGIDWCEDATNHSMEYTRNRIRGKVLPEMETGINAKTVSHLSAFGKEMRETAEFLDMLTQKAMKACAQAAPGKGVVFCKSFLQEPVFLRERIVRAVLKEVGCGLKDIRREHIEKVVSLSEGQSGKEIILPGGWRAGKSFDRLVIQKKVSEESRECPMIPLLIPGETRTPFGTFFARVFPNENQPIPQNKYTKWLNYDKITCDITLRGRAPGDFLIINRQGGRKKLKAYFIEEKVPSAERDRIPLLTIGSEVLWVTGYRISEGYKVEKSTETILEITYKEENHGRKDQRFN